MTVTTLDTLTSLITGITTFSVMGNLKHELRHTDITKVIGSGGTGLVFISYPDAIAKAPFSPQVGYRQFAIPNPIFSYPIVDILPKCFKFLLYTDSVNYCIIFFTFQFFAVLFFSMLAILGVGSGVALFSSVNTIIIDAMPNAKFAFPTVIGCTAGFLVGLVYVTPVSKA